jgi:hypothetical protein
MSKRDDDSEGPSLPAPPPRKKRVVNATLIDHSYNDYSTYRITNNDDSNKGHCSIDNFPRKLHHILSTPGYHHIISWMPHGRAWKIWNRELLVSVVCKEQFKHEKFESFNRQVNGWGFKVRKLQTLIVKIHGRDFYCRLSLVWWRLTSAVINLNINSVSFGMVPTTNATTTNFFCEGYQISPATCIVLINQARGFQTNWMNPISTRSVACFLFQK